MSVASVYLFGAALGLSLSFFLLPLSQLQNDTEKLLTIDPDSIITDLKIRDVVMVTVILQTGNDEEMDEKISLTKQTWAREIQEKIEFYIYGNSKEHSDVNNQIVSLPGLFSPLSIRLQVVQNLCATHINASQWFVMISSDVYVQMEILKYVVEPFDPENLAYLSESSQVNDEQGLCGDGRVEIMSHELLAATCAVFTACNISEQNVNIKCLKTRLNGICSVTPPMHVCMYVCIYVCTYICM